MCMKHALNWTPGNHGKGIVTPEGEAHTWNVDRQDGTPNHQEYLEQALGAHDTNPYSEYNAFEIGPEGRVYEGPEDIDKLDPRLVPTNKWRFQSAAEGPVQVVDVNHPVKDEPHAPAYCEGPLDKPFAYDPVARTVYLGQPGGYHTDMVGYVPHDNVLGLPQGRLRAPHTETNPYTDDVEHTPVEADWFSKPPENHEEVHQALGAAPLTGKWAWSFQHGARVAKNDGKWQLVSGTAYHWAPKQFRDQIAQEGLRAALPEGDEYVDYDNPEAYRGVYIFNKPPAYNHGTGGFYGDDLWSIDTNGLEPQTDPGEFDASMVPHDIGPDRIRYLNGQAHRRAWEKFNAERHGHVISDMRDGWGRFATTAPWEYGQWGKGIYYPETGALRTWADDRTHMDVWGDEENYAQPGSAHHIVIRPNGTVHDQGAFDRDFGDAETDVPGLQQALKELDPRLQLDAPDSWSFGPTEPMESEPSAISRGEQGDADHGVQTSNDFAGSL
jgi:hypothetical protein